MTLVDRTQLTGAPTGATRADFYSGRYCTSADVHCGDRRLIDALRDASRQYLDVRRVCVTDVTGSEPPVDYADGLLSKSDLDWLIVRAEPPRAEARLYGYVRKIPVRVAFLLSSCRIEGTVHIEGNQADPVVFFLRGLEKGTDRFVAVTGASISQAPAAIEDSAGLVIVNRAAVRLFSVLR